MKRNKVGKIIFVIGICLFMVGLGYIVTKYLDKNMYLNTNLLITFEDSKEFELESTEVFDKESALNVYPNKFTIENKSLKGVKYNIILKEIDSNVDKENIGYILYLNDKEVKYGNISNLKDNLYTNDIGMKKKDNYKLYIYLKEEISDPIFKYKLEVTSK